MPGPLNHDATIREAGEPRRRAYALGGSAVAVAVALLVGACGGGGGGSPGVAKLGGSHGGSASSPSSSSGGGASAGGSLSTSSAGGTSGLHLAISVGSRNAALKFSRCMRANGVPNFPDPNGSGAIQFGSGNGIDPRAPGVRTAMQKCRKDLPTPHFTPAQEQAAKAAALRFSQCMRSHGVTDYPDPQFGPGGRVALKLGGPGSGFDPNSPSFQRAMNACASSGLGPKGFGAPTIAK
jgi:hypothetical protein